MVRNSLKISLVLCLGLFGISSCNDCISGVGEPIVQVLDIPEFNSLNISGSTGVTISQGNEQKVEITAPQNIIDLLNRSVTNETWDVHFEECVRAKKLEINITVPTIRNITVSGSGNVKGLNNLNVSNLELNIIGSGKIDLMVNCRNATANINGSGDIKLTGSATNLDALVSGSGDFEGSEFTTVKSNINIIGSGDASVNASELYEVNITGSGDVEYKDTGARIISDVRGSGEITRK